MTDKSSAFALNISRLFSRSARTLSPDEFSELLRWKTNRLMPLLGWPGVMAIGLLVILIPFYFSAIRPLQTNLASLRLDLVTSHDRSLKHDEVDHSLDTPSGQLAKFYQFFPPEKTSPHLLGMMVEIANRKGLALNHGEYAVVNDTEGQLRRYKITLPVQGTYPQIRQYLAILIKEIPSMTLENVQFERKDITDTDLQAKIKLVLYLRQQS